MPRGNFGLSSAVIFMDVQTNHEIDQYTPQRSEFPIVRDIQVKIRSNTAGGGAQELRRIVYKMVMVSIVRVEKESKPLYNASKAILGKTFFKNKIER